jgi:hypothetical protein
LFSKAYLRRSAEIFAATYIIARAHGCGQAPIAPKMVLFIFHLLPFWDFLWLTAWAGFGRRVNQDGNKEKRNGC